MQEQICPYCNGLEILGIVCPACGAPMEDSGTLQEALGPYSPYEENSLAHARYGCVHQVVCRICAVDYLYTVRLFPRRMPQFCVEGFTYAVSSHKRRGGIPF